MEVAGAPPSSVEQMAASPQFAAFWADMQASVDGQIIDGRTVITAGADIDRDGAVNVPTLLLGGSDSPGRYHDSLAALEAVLPLVERRTLEGQSHLAHLADPGQFASAIAGFVRLAPG